MKRRLSALILSGLGAGALFAAASDHGDEPPSPVDHAAVDQYIEQLSETLPPHPANARATETPEDPKLAKAAGRLDRVEPMVGAALNVVR